MNFISLVSFSCLLSLQLWNNCNDNRRFRFKFFQKATFYMYTLGPCFPLVKAKVLIHPLPSVIVQSD